MSATDLAHDDDNYDDEDEDGDDDEDDGDDEMGITRREYLENNLE